MYMYIYSVYSQMLQRSRIKMFHNVPQKRVQVAILFQELFSSKPCQNHME